MKGFFAKKPLGGKINTLTIITNLVVIILLVGTTLAFRHYFRKINFENRTEIIAHGVAGSLSSHTPSYIREKGSLLLSKLVAREKSVVAAHFFINGEKVASFRRLSANRLNQSAIITPETISEQITSQKGLNVIRRSSRLDALIEEEGHLILYTQGAPFGKETMIVVGMDLVVAFLALVLALAISQKLQHVISEPFLILAEATDKIAKEKDFSTRVYSPSKDEIGRLYHGFNHMLDEIERRDETIHETNEVLEDRVDERTVELKKAKAETERINNQLREANVKLKASVKETQQLAVEAEAASKAKSDFLAAVSHEIRTPMNGVIGFTNLLLESNLDENQCEYAHTIKSQGESLLILINDILDFSKIEAGKFFLDFTTFDMFEACNEIIDFFSTQATSQKIDLELFYEPGAKKQLRGDSGRIKQVMLNLISNALKFTDNGFIHVSVAAWSDENHRPGLKISVSDTGIGIPVGKQDLLFHKFSQTDASTTRKYGGTGLGLAICKELVTMMRGQIGFKSQTGKGSVFWFTLPILELDKQNQSTILPLPLPKSSEGGDPTLSETTLLRGLRVLLVEDNTVNQKLANKILTRMGCVVDLACNGRKAVSMAEKQPYDVIFMDCQMPEMDGYEATRRIRRVEGMTDPESRKRVPIIAITANAMYGDRDKCLKEGMDDYIAKPVDARQIGRILKRWYEPRRQAT
ncbi:MAG: ATP-binding protein [Verrucomicrobiota bacterium]|nr:ATP-binding protein [Verrucomicrobiota bacterium]